MGRAALSETDHAAFRHAMRDAATRLFAKHGASGVTLRRLAKELGISPMTPYRYFRDKAEIFDMVRAAAIEGFAVAQERAFAKERDPLRRLHAMGRAYLGYGLAYPDQYRIMFQLEHRRGANRELAALDRRGWTPMRETVRACVDAGVFTGDPDELAHIYWAAMHGLVMLHLAGKLRLGLSLEALVQPTIDLLIKGSR
jgi:AcrR family transcriptional regulator